MNQLQLTDKERALLLVTCMNMMMDNFDGATAYTRAKFKNIPMETMKDAIRQALGLDIDQNEVADLMVRLYESLPAAVPADAAIN